MFSLLTFFCLVNRKNVFRLMFVVLIYFAGHCVPHVPHSDRPKIIEDDDS